jgi:hypothetical protein
MEVQSERLILTVATYPELRRQRLASRCQELKSY